MSRTVPTPNQTAVKTYPNPTWSGEVLDELLIERFEFNKASWVKLPEGTPHENTRDFPNHKLLKESYDGQYGIVTRYWCNGYRNEDQYNYDINYSAESNSHPIFSRRYLVRRDQYVPLAKGSTFTGVYLIEVTDEGSGYDPNSPPTVTISGGGGANAAAKAIVSNDGKVQWVYLTNEGSGYTSTPTVSFSSGTATAVAKTELSSNVVYSYTITNGGTGYVSAPLVTIVGTGSGATGVAQVSGGSIVGIMPTSYGSGYSAASVIFSGGGGINGAATANLEPITPVLVKEDVQQFPEDDPRRSLYVIVQRQYEATPGPILIEHKFEPFISTYVSIHKSIVLKSTVPWDMYYEAREEGQIIEYSPLTDVRYIKCVSQINPLIAWENGGEDEEFFGTAPYSFPNEVPVAPTVEVWYAYLGTSLDIAFGWNMNVKEGYSGPCPARFVRRWTFDPNDAAYIAALPQVTYIKPEGNVIQGGFVYSGGNLIAQTTQFVIPSTLHPELEIVVNTNGLGGGPPSVVIETVPATVPTSLPPGTEIVASVSKPQAWLFGLYYTDICFVTVPSPP